MAKLHTDTQRERNSIVTSNKRFYEIRLQSGLHTSIETTNPPGQSVHKLSATAIHAILGAVWQDCKDLSILKRVIEKLELSQCEDRPQGNVKFFV